MQEIDQNDVINNYSSDQEIWQNEDKWHQYNFSEIKKFLLPTRDKYSNTNTIILNAGSGGQNYGFNEVQMYHIDIVDAKIKEKVNYIVGDIQQLPYVADFFNLVLCVGEVINYCDAQKSISEFARVLKIGGEVIIEYESSRTLELIFKKEFNSSSVIINTFYRGKQEKIWYYSESYISNLLSTYGFEITRIDRFHLLSIFVYRITKSQNFAAKFSKLDSVIKLIPWINKCASNVILTAVKTS